VGIGNTSPAGTLDVSGGAFIRGTLQLPAIGTATKTSGFNSNTLDLLASSFNTSAAVPQLFRWQAEPVGNNTASPSGKLNLLYLSGAGTPAETGLSIAGNGLISFASGQTFPGTGTVTSVGSGAGLTGGPITSTGILSIPTAGVTDAMLANPYSGTGTCGAGSFVTTLARSAAPNCAAGNPGTITGVTAGTGLTGGGTSGNVTLNVNEGTVAFQSDLTTGVNTAETFATNAANTAQANAITTAETFATNAASTAQTNAITTAETFATNAASTAQTSAVSTAETYANGAFLPLTGGTLTGTLGGTQATFSGASSALTFAYGLCAYALSGDTTDGGGCLGEYSNTVFTGLAVQGDYAVVATGSTNAMSWGVTGSGTEVGVTGSGVASSLGNNTTGVYGGGDTGVHGSGSNYGVYCDGNFAATGSKSAVVALPDDRQVLLYTVESPENWFEDFGSGELDNGVASIQLDPTFAQTVSPEVGYHVFVTPNGDCEGLYVARKSGTSFEVRELRGGKSSVAFDYRIVAKRRGLESLRLEQVSADHEMAEAMRKHLAERPSHVPKLHPPKLPEPPKTLPKRLPLANPPKR
jgi:hypothetical protein